MTGNWILAGRLGIIPREAYLAGRPRLDGAAKNIVAIMKFVLVMEEQMIKRGLIPVLLVALLALVWAGIDYFLLPVYNFQSFNFWVLLAVCVGLLAFILGGLLKSRKATLIGSVSAGAIVVVAILLSAGSWLVWPGNSGRLFRQLSVTEKAPAAFFEDFPDAAAKGGEAQNLILPRTDKELSIAIAQGKLGNYGARFRMSSDIFTAISVRDSSGTRIVRVSPLDYTSTMVALTGGSAGTAGYIEVDQLTEEAKLVAVPGGMKYTPGAIFSYDLDRHVRFGYRTALLGAKSFEIDDEGKPFWIVPVMKNMVGLFGGAERKGIITVDPASGDMSYYEAGAEPSWVDRAVPTDTAIAQANNNLKLGNGWINLIFGQKRDVFQLSDSYNYVVSKGADGAHTWLVSGITSPSDSDQTLVGFMMIDMRTKEARRYPMSGITEMRAMEIAVNDERVRAQNLQATWPILVDLGGEGAYYLFLKNDVQRQRFVYIDLATGRKVAMSDSLEGARAQFAQMVGSKAASAEETRKASGSVLRVRENAQDGTMLFLLAGEPEVLYTVKADLSNGTRFLSSGDKVELSYRELPSAPDTRYVIELRNAAIGAK